MLTDKQIEIVQMLNLNIPRNTIAEKLNVKPKTVKTYIHSIYKRLRVNSVETLLIEATKLNIIAGCNNVNVSIGEALRAYRAKHKILQKNMAKRLNITQSTINKIESKVHKPTAETTFKILQIINPKLIDDINKTIYSTIENGKEYTDWLEKTNNYRDN